MKKIIQKLSSFVYSNGLEMRTVFNDWLRYMINGFTLNGKPLDDWNYSTEDNKFFSELMIDWFIVMRDNVEKLGWFDALGEIYTEIVLSKSHADNTGQFFTPEHICDLMTMINVGDKKIMGQKIGDPACGSGRNLLSFNAKSPGNYLVGEDIDITCCYMTVCNFMIHGAKGEVICHDSLFGRNYNGAWQTGIMPGGIPFVMEVNREQMAETKTILPIKPQQLDLFAI